MSRDLFDLFNGSRSPRPRSYHAAFAPWLALALCACVGVQEPPAGDPPPNADPLLGCSGSCHGDQNSIAPPADTSGQTDPSLRTIGAHRSHLSPAPVWHRTLSCSDCHQVPGGVGDAGHMDTPAPAELTFGALAATGGVTPEWDGATCSNVYCHGATLQGGTVNQPTWTLTDGSQSACGSCHAFPPPAPHPAADDCGTCHPTIQPGTVEFLDPDSHINGQVDLNTDGAGNNGACDSCHGSGGVAAPPIDTAGNTERTSPGVGAHREHIGASDWHRQLYCAQCHIVPVNVGDPTHIDATPGAELNFDSLNPTAVYDAATNTCQNLYCHGNGRSQNGTMQWTEDPTLDCGSCHEDGSRNGETLSGKHKKHIEKNYDCVECHQAVVNQQLDIVDPELHINGVHDIQIESGGEWSAPNRRCTNLSCHENETW